LVWCESKILDRADKLFLSFCVLVGCLSGCPIWCHWVRRRSASTLREGFCSTRSMLFQPGQQVLARSSNCDLTWQQGIEGNPSSKILVDYARRSRGLSAFANFEHQGSLPPEACIVRPLPSFRGLHNSVSLNAFGVLSGLSFTSRMIAAMNDMHNPTQRQPGWSVLGLDVAENRRIKGEHLHYMNMTAASSVLSIFDQRQNTQHVPLSSSLEVDSW